MSILNLLDRPIAYHRPFAAISGSICGGVFLSQAFYWSQRTSDPDGWFWKTQEQWFNETFMSRYEQETARKKLIAIGVLEQKRQGLPAKLFYRIDREALEVKMQNYADKYVEIPHTGVMDSSRQVSGKPADNLCTENTSESTSEINTPLTPKGEEIAANQTSLFSEESQDQKTNPCQNSKSINQDIPLVPPRPPSKPPKLTAEEKAEAKKEKARIADLEFEQFWAIVDYKQGRELAHRRFIALVASGVSAIVLIQKRKEQQDWHDAKSGNSKYLKRPATWLGTDASGWTDEMEATPIAPQSDSLPTFQPQTSNATERFENQFKNPQRHLGLIESGHGDIMIGKGLLDFDPTLVEVAILHLKKCKLPFEVLDGKRFILNRIRQADWAAIELLKESAATIAGDRKKTEAAIAASANSGSEYYDTSRYYIPEPPVIDLEARAKATEGGRAKMRETIAQALKNRAS